MVKTNPDVNNKTGPTMHAAPPAAVFLTAEMFEAEYFIKLHFLMLRQCQHFGTVIRVTVAIKDFTNVKVGLRVVSDHS